MTYPEDFFRQPNKMRLAKTYGDHSYAYANQAWYLMAYGNLIVFGAPFLTSLLLLLTGRYELVPITKMVWFFHDYAYVILVLDICAGFLVMMW